MKGLYIHIPFCKRICSYCDFPKMVSNDTNKTKYINKLILEINSYKKYFDEIDTVYIGGGTPNSISLELLDKLLTSIDPILKKSKESSIELNPEFITNDLCILLSKHNINRVSLGVESINPKTIKLINRCHSKEIVKNSILMLKSNGITNINCDFIFGFPYEDITDVKNNIDFIKELDITHVSYYSLILEDKTVFKYQYDKGLLELPNDDLVADMYYFIKKELNNIGFNHYEISNFAKEGFESLHNLKYWNEEEYIGCGMASSGFISDIRYENRHILKDYLENDNLIYDSIKLEIIDKKKEFMMMGLRMINGVSIKRYNMMFNSDVLTDFKTELDKLLKEDMIEIENDHIRIKPDKLFIGNICFREFV